MKRIVPIILCIMFVLSIGFISVSANNSLDTTFNFNFSGSATQDTNARSKQDNSSSYMKCTSANYSYTGSVYAQPEGGGWVDASNGYYYNFSAGTTHYMLNWVKEWGYNSSGITGVSWSGGYASGLWSPDSV